MDSSPVYANFSCELRIIKARNVEFIKSTKNMFARLYLPTGNNKIIQLNSKKVSTKSLPFWDECFNLDCSCSEEFLKSLNQQSLVLELRQRKMWGSQLVGKCEIPWKVVLESQNMELKKWFKINLMSGCDCNEGTSTSPEVEIEIKIKVASVGEKEKRNNWNECGCKNGHDHHAWCNVEDSDVFALVAALEAY